MFDRALERRKIWAKPIDSYSILVHLQGKDCPWIFIKWAKTDWENQLYVWKRLYAITYFVCITFLIRGVNKVSFSLLPSAILFY